MLSLYRVFLITYATDKKYWSQALLPKNSFIEVCVINVTIMIFFQIHDNDQKLMMHEAVTSGKRSDRV